MMKLKMKKWNFCSGADATSTESKLLLCIIYYVVVNS